MLLVSLNTLDSEAAASIPLAISSARSIVRTASASNLFCMLSARSLHTKRSFKSLVEESIKLAGHDGTEPGNHVLILPQLVDVGRIEDVWVGNDPLIVS